MKKVLLLFGLLSTLFIAFPANAERINLDQLSCGMLDEIARSDENAAAVLIIWIDGYLSGITGDTSFDDAYLEQFTNNLGEACAKSPEAMVLSVAKIIGVQER